jgi:hypothetical protein
VPRLSRHAAPARVYCGDELELRRIGDVIIGARNHGLSRLQRLPQTFQNARLEFRKLIKKQHAVMGQRHFAGFGAKPAADKGRHAGRVMGRTERLAPREPAILQFTAEGSHHADVEHFARIHGRQYRRQALRQHGLACTGRTHHQECVIAGTLPIRQLSCQSLPSKFV